MDFKSGKMKFKGLPNGNSWASNVIKSLGYSSKEMISLMMPATMDLYSTNSEIVTDAVRDLRSMKAASKRLLNTFIDDEYIQISRDAIANAKADIKSGKFYNKERADRAMFGDDNDDFDFDFDDDGNADFSIGGDDDDNGGVNVNISTNITQDNPMVQATVHQTETIVNVGEALQKTQLAIANHQMIADKKMIEMLTAGMSTINSNIGLLVEFNNSNMTKFTGASLSYYDESLKLLREIKDSLTPKEKTATEQQQEKKEDPMEYLFTNTFSIENYSKILKKQINSATDNDMVLGMLKSFLSDKDMLRSLAANPLSFIPTMMVTKLMPSVLSNAMTSFDKSLKEFFPAFLMKIGSMRGSDNWLKNMVGEVFGLRPQQKESVDFSKYNKGPMSFDGQTKYAIVNVIPTYLRKILAAVSGKEEVAINWETGKMENLTAIDKSWVDTVNRTKLNPISDIVNKLEDRLDAFEFANKQDKKDFMAEMRKFLLKNQSSRQFLDLKRTTKDGMAFDPIADIYDMGMTNNKIMKALLLSLSRADQMRLAGSGKVQSMMDVKALYEKAESGELPSNVFTLMGDDSTSSIFDRTASGDIKRDKKGNAVINMANSIRAGGDKYNLTPADYLRDIRSLLADGIITYSAGMASPTTARRRGRYVSAGFQSDSLSHITELKSAMQKEKDEYYKRTSSTSSYTALSEEEKQKLIDEGNGRRGVNSLYEVSQYSDEQLIDIFQSREKELENSRSLARTKKIGDIATTWNNLKAKVGEILKSPASLLAGLFDRVDKTMYELVFGNNAEGTSFFSKILDTIQGKLDFAWNWTKEKVFNPLREFLFDGPDSLKEKFKNSAFYQWLTSKSENIKDYLFGEKLENGERGDGGLFSSVYKEMKLMGKKMNHYIIGSEYIDPVTGEKVGKNENSVFANFSGLVKDYSRTMKEYLFGAGDGNDRGILAEGFHRIQEGFQSFADAIFGYRYNDNGEKISNFIASDFFKNMKERAPKAFAVGIAGAGLGILNGFGGGLLGGLFLPGGPIGGAILGTTLGFLNQSENFQRFMFGDKDENGERMGGLISKKTQEFFSKHKAAIIGGATLGSVKSMLGIGILPSIFGGPIAGAALGVGTSLLFRSDQFKNLMFGEEVDGKRMGGLVGKITAGFKDKDGKNTFGKVAAGGITGATMGLIASKFGLIGATLLGGGPLMGALLGIGSGLALTNEKWKTALFGEWNADKNIREGGLFGKFINWTKLQIFAPLKLKFQEINLNIAEWFENSIANPFKDALAPIKHEFHNMVQNMKDLFKQGWENFTGYLGKVFEKYVGEPFGKVMEERILKPLKSFFGRIIKGAGDIIGGVLSAPFKAMSAVAVGLQGKHERQGLQNARDAAWGKLREQGGFFNWDNWKGIFKTYADKDTKEQARLEGAPYKNELAKEKELRDRTTQTKYAIKRALLERDKKALKDRQLLAEGADYDNVYIDENGNKVYIDETYDLRNKEDIERAAKAHAKAALAQDKDADKPSSDTNPKIKISEGFRGEGTSSESKDNKSGDSTPKIRIKASRGLSRGDLAGVKISRPSDSKVVSADMGGTETASVSDNTSQPSSEYDSSNARINEDYTNKVNKKGGLFSGKQSNSMLDLTKQIAKDVRNIASEVYGQLDGVGSNVYKIRKIVQKKEGISDEDLTGAANRDRKGFFGKLRSALYAPIQGILEWITQPLQKVVDGIVFVKDKFVEFGKSIFKLPAMIFNGVKTAAGELYGALKYTAKAFINIPAMILDGMNTILKTAFEAVKAFGPLISKSLAGVGEVIKGFGLGVSYALKDFGRGFGEVLYGMGSAAGEFIKGMGSLIPSVFKLAKGAFEVITDAGVGVLKAGFKGVFELASMGFNALMTPLRFINKAMVGLTKVGVPNKVIIKGFDKPLDVRVINKVATIPTTTTDGLPSNIKADFTTASSRGSDVSSVKINNVNESVEDGDIDSEASATLSALHANEIYEAREEARKQKEAEANAKLAERQTDATDQTAAAKIAENNAKEKEAQEREYKERMLAASEKTAKSTTEHKSAWDFIFGKKGLITAAALLALPLIPKILEWIGNIQFPSLGDIGNIIKNIITNEAGRTDENGEVIENAGGQETVTKQGIKLGITALDNVLSSGPVKAMVKGVKGAVKVTKNVVKKTGEFVGAKIPNKAKDICAKALSTLDNFLKTIGEKISGKFGNTMAGKAIKFLKDVFKKVFTPKNIANSADDVAKAAAKDGAKVASAGVIMAIFALYDGVSGAYEVRRVFKLPKEYGVTATMRIVAGIIKALTNLSAVASIGIMLAEEFLGMNIIQDLAIGLLNIFDSEAAEFAQGGYEQFQDQLAAYNEEHGTQLTEAAWNDKNNKTMFQDIQSNVENIKKWGIDAWTNTKNTVSNAWNATKEAAGNAWNTVKDTASGAWNAAGQWINDTAYNVGKSVVDGSGWSDEAVRKNLGLSEDAPITMGQRISSTMAQLSNYTPFGFFLPADWKAQKLEAARAKVNLFIEATHKAWDDMKQGFGDWWNDTSKFLGDKWTEAKDVVFTKAGEFKEGIKEGLISLDNTMGLMLGYKDKNGNPISVSQAFKNSWDVINTAREKLFTGIKEGFDRIKESFFKKVEEIKEKIWGAMGAVGDAINKTIGNAGDAYNRMQSYDDNDFARKMEETGYVNPSSIDLSQPVSEYDDDFSYQLASQAAKGITKETFKKKVTLATGDKDRAWVLFTDLKNRISASNGSVKTGLDSFLQSYGSEKPEVLRSVLSMTKEYYKQMNNKSAMDIVSKAESGLNKAGAASLSGAGTGMQYYSQTDPKWAGQRVGNGTMADLGCGPTAMSMIASSMGINAKPDMIQNYVNQRGYASSQGVHASFVGDTANALGMNARQIMGPQLNQSLNNGPVLLLGRDGSNGSPYTSAGHYVVATKGSGGKVNIMDPRGRGMSRSVGMDKLGGTVAAWAFGAGETAGERLVRTMRSIEGTLHTYTQGSGRLSIESGQGDCSGVTWWVYNKALGLDIGTGGTKEQLTKGIVVVNGNGYYPGKLFADPNVLNKMKPGDLIFYGLSRTQSTGSGKNPGGRHVEMYMGNGQISGQGWGSGNGPMSKPVTTSIGDKYPVIEVRRYVDDDGKPLSGVNLRAYTPSPTSASGSSGDGVVETGSILGDITQSLSKSFEASGLSTLTDMTASFTSIIGKNLLGEYEKTTSSNSGGFDINSAMIDGSVTSGYRGPASMVGLKASDMRNRDLLKWDPITAEQLNAYITKMGHGPGTGSMFANKGQAFIDAGKATGIDPRFILALGAQESGWGTSDFARQRANFFGIAAYNSDPNKAYKFLGPDGKASTEVGVMEGAKWIKRHYVDKGNDTMAKFLYNKNPGAYCVDNSGVPSESWLSSISSIMAGVGAGDGLSIDSIDGYKYPIKNNKPIGLSLSGAGTVDMNNNTPSSNNVVNINATTGRDTEILREIVTVLKAININTGGSKSSIDNLLVKMDNLKTGGNNIIAVPNSNKNNLNKLDMSADKVADDAYKRAKLLAQGKLA